MSPVLSVSFIPLAALSTGIPISTVFLPKVLSDDGFFRTVKHFHYSYLRKAFQTALLCELEKQIGPSFKKTKAAIYKKDKNGFYVYAKPNLCVPDTVVKYISRYLGRPVIATSMIDSYDSDFVTLHYNRHEDDAYIEETVPVLDFIKLLIQHIPEKHFKMTHYYGFYTRHRGTDNVLHKAVRRSSHRILLNFNRWRTLILLSFGYDPLQCPKCSHKIEILTCLTCIIFLLRMMILMTMNLKKAFILTFFNHRLFPMPAFGGLFHSRFLR